MAVALQTRSPQVATWWEEALRAKPVGELACPRWLSIAALPSIDRGSSLTETQILSLLAALKSSKVHPLVVVLQERGNSTMLAEFVWAVFWQWQSKGGDGKDNWALRALGWFGDDSTVLKLTPVLREMPGLGQYKRAAMGLDCLRMIGSDMALMSISNIANKVKYKSLKEKANACMDEIGKARNLTREQLEDRIVPDCGFEVGGGRWFEYGDRLLQVVFGEQMQLLVRDERGNGGTSLPKGADDAVKAEWKALKAQVSAVVKAQVARLEQGMIRARRWDWGEFERLLRHPVMGPLMGRLIWGSGDGRLGESFRVTEDGSYADIRDEPFVPEVGVSVGLVHPAHLSEGERALWGEILNDYEIFQPFRQLNRTVFGLEAGEEAEILRFGKIDVPNNVVLTILKKGGWSYREEGRRILHCKSIAYAGVTAVVQHSQTVYAGYDSGTSRMERCWFVAGDRLSAEQIEPGRALLLGEVDPMAVSEVLRTLGAIAAKGE
jgi:hypothetical protein